MLIDLSFCTDLHSCLQPYPQASSTIHSSHFLKQRSHWSAMSLHSNCSFPPTLNALSFSYEKLKIRNKMSSPFWFFSYTTLPCTPPITLWYITAMEPYTTVLNLYTLQTVPILLISMDTDLRNDAWLGTRSTKRSEFENLAKVQEQAQQTLRIPFRAGWPLNLPHQPRPRMACRPALLTPPRRESKGTELPPSRGNSAETGAEPGTEP